MTFWDKAVIGGVLWLMGLGMASMFGYYWLSIILVLGAIVMSVWATYDVMRFFVGGK